MLSHPVYVSSLSLQIAALETQSTRDVTTITRLNAEIKKVSETVGNSNTEICRLQRSVSRVGLLPKLGWSVRRFFNDCECRALQLT